MAYTSYELGKNVILLSHKVKYLSSVIILKVYLYYIVLFLNKIEKPKLIKENIDKLDSIQILNYSMIKYI